MASIQGGHEATISPPGSIPLADALVPASIFAPDRGGCGEDADDECFEDGDAFNGEPEDRGVDFSNKVTLGLVCFGTPVLPLAGMNGQLIVSFSAHNHAITQRRTLRGKHAASVCPLQLHKIRALV